MKKIYDSICALTGGTPHVRLHKIENRHSLGCKIIAKLEYFNPAGSVKDRAAKEMIEAAEKRGELKSGSVIIEPTSGNTGIGLAAIAAAKGYRTVIVMPDSMSRERQVMMRAYGADVVLTPGALGMKGAIKKAEELSKDIPDSFIPSQFDNPDNKAAHFKTTGPEIYEATDGEVDIFVAGVGTGGTISGVGEYLKSKNDDIKIVAVEPYDSPVLSGGEANSHKIQGIGAGFVPSVLNTEIYDEVITVTKDEAYSFAKELGMTEGIAVGISSGAALAAAVRVAQRAENEGKTLVVLLPDGGERYMSTPMFE
jgi:cysteine synthase A